MVTFDGPAPRIEQKDGYEVWHARGETVARVGSTETLANVVVEQTAADAALNIAAIRADDATIRDVGWRGIGHVHSDTQGWGTNFHLAVSGNVTVENIYIDDRAPPGQTGSTRIGGGFCPQHHAGQVDVRNTFIAGTGNNAFYGSNPGKDDGQNGTVTFEDCYHRDNVVGQYRIGTPGSYVRNCVGVLHDPDGRRGKYPGGGSKNARLVWGRHFPEQLVEDSAFFVSPNDANHDAAFMTWYRSGRSHGSRNELIVRNSDLNPDAPQVESERAGGTVTLENLGEQPAEAVLVEGVPTTPEMAARGDRHIPDIPELPGDGGNGGGQPPEPSTVQITNDGSARTNYDIRLGEGQITSTSGLGQGDSVSADRTRIAGFVRGGTDQFTYEGCISEASFDGPAPALTRDGQPVSPDTLPDCSTDTPPIDEVAAATLALALGVGAAVAISDLPDDWRL